MRGPLGVGVMVIAGVLAAGAPAARDPSSVAPRPTRPLRSRPLDMAGERFAISGIGNGTLHLHFGLLLDNQVEQDSWAYILRGHEVRKVLGNDNNSVRLP